MLIVEKKTFALGLVMAVAFLVVLVLMFSPLFGEENAFQAADRLFNSIAKGSSDHFDELREQAGSLRGSQVQLEVSLKDESTAEIAGVLLAKAGLGEKVGATRVTIAGDIERLALAVIADSEELFHNNGEEIAAKYGYPDREVLIGWWSALKEAQKVLREKGSFAAASYLEEVTMKGVEVAYNFYDIEPKGASANAGIITFSLAFYILYTLWWGYAILYLFHGLGMEMKAGRKKEV